MHKRPMSKRRIILLIVLGAIVLLIAGTAIGFVAFVKSGGYQLLDDVLTKDTVERVTLTYGIIGYEPVSYTHLFGIVKSYELVRIWNKSI